MIDSPYYFLREFTEATGDAPIEIETALSGEAVREFRYFINGSETASYGVSRDVETGIIKIRSRFLAGDVYEIVKILPLIQPFLIRTSDDFPANAPYYLAAQTRLLIQDYLSRLG